MLTFPVPFPESIVKLLKLSAVCAVVLAIALVLTMMVAPVTGVLMAVNAMILVLLVGHGHETAVGYGSLAITYLNYVAIVSVVTYRFFVPHKIKTKAETN